LLIRHPEISCQKFELRSNSSKNSQFAEYEVQETRCGDSGFSTIRVKIIAVELFKKKMIFYGTKQPGDFNTASFSVNMSDFFVDDIDIRKIHSEPRAICSQDGTYPSNFKRLVFECRAQYQFLHTLFPRIYRFSDVFSLIGNENLMLILKYALNFTTVMSMARLNKQGFLLSKNEKIWRELIEIDYPEENRKINGRTNSKERYKTLYQAKKRWLHQQQSCYFQPSGLYGQFPCPPKHFQRQQIQKQVWFPQQFMHPLEHFEFPQLSSTHQIITDHAHPNPYLFSPGQW